MTEQKAIDLLEAHGLRKTKVRIEVVRRFLDSDHALPQQELEGFFDQVDRITLYRTLRTFEEKGLIHTAIDGSQKVKYALCGGGCTEHHHLDNHAHFHCDQCGKTFCLDKVAIPAVSSPKGFRVEATYLIMKGVCEVCQS